MHGEGEAVQLEQPARDVLVDQILEHLLQRVDPLIRRGSSVRRSLQRLLEQPHECGERDSIEVVQLRQVRDGEVEVRRKGGHRQVDVALSQVGFLKRYGLFKRSL